MMGRILCAIGLHHWVTVYVSQIFPMSGELQCSRSGCRKVLVECMAGWATYDREG